MVMVNLQGKEIGMDGFLKQKLDNILKIQKRNFDALILVDGKERIGKSTLALTIGAYLYPKISINNIAIDTNDAIMKLEHLPDKSLLIIDEGSLIFSSKDAMRTEQRKILKILNVIGQRNMIFIIVLPSFFDLNKYIATSRARFLIHCYSDRALNRGRFAYWGTRKLTRLYMQGKKNFGSYKWPSADFRGRFHDYHPSWYDEYLKTKEKTLIASMKDTKKKSDMDFKDYCTYLMLKYKERSIGVKFSDICKGFGVAESTFYDRKKSFIAQNKHILAESLGFEPLQL